MNQKLEVALTAELLFDHILEEFLAYLVLSPTAKNYWLESISSSKMQLACQLRQLGWRIEDIAGVIGNTERTISVWTRKVADIRTERKDFLLCRFIQENPTIRYQDALKYFPGTSQEKFIRLSRPFRPKADATGKYMDPKSGRVFLTVEAIHIRLGMKKTDLSKTIRKKEISWQPVWQIKTENDRQIRVYDWEELLNKHPDYRRRGNIRDLTNGDVNSLLNLKPSNVSPSSWIVLLTILTIRKAVGGWPKFDDLLSLLQKTYGYQRNTIYSALENLINPRPGYLRIIRYLSKKYMSFQIYWQQLPPEVSLRLLMTTMADSKGNHFLVTPDFALPQAIIPINRPATPKQALDLYLINLNLKTQV